MQFLQKIRNSIISLIILIILISSFFILKFALQKEKIYTPKMIDNQILTDFEVDVPEGVAAIRIDKKSGNVSKSFTNSYFEYFLEENIDDLLASKSENSDLKEILN